MKNTLKAQLFSLLILAGCSQSTLDEKKSELTDLRGQQIELIQQIETLEQEIRDEDPDFEKAADLTTLVSVMEVPIQDFHHKIEVRGSVESRKNIIISAELPGRMNEIKVREGQRVSKGELLMVLDSESISRNIDELKTQLDLAKIVYERQARLWQQNVGSEIQYLEAKNNKEAVEKRLASMYTELNKTKIRAPFSGSIDEIPIREGEFMMMGMPLVRMVSLSELYIKADVSERFIGKFKKGDEVEVYLPASEERVFSKITALSDVINLDNRTFNVEVDLSSIDQELRPNMVVVLQLTDYRNENATVIPTKIIQNDDVGPFVFKIIDNGAGKKAEKFHIETGASYRSMTEVFKGLTKGEQVIDQGFRELSNGMAVKIADKES
jgi:RND family efflux transporter MFP subunit